MPKHFHITITLLVYVYVYVKAPLQVRYRKYSTRGGVEWQLSTAQGEAECCI